MVELVVGDASVYARNGFLVQYKWHGHHRMKIYGLITICPSPTLPLLLVIAPGGAQQHMGFAQCVQWKAYIRKMPEFKWDGNCTGIGGW